MEFELDRHDFKDLKNISPRPKTALRLKYEAEVRAFKNRYFGIENVRKTLGFSQRKMCQLLLVDPSAWSRWLKDESKIPPHIYRALEWLILAQEKNPDLIRVMGAGLMSGPRGSASETEVLALKERIQQLEGEMEQIKTKNLASTAKFMVFLIGLFALALLVILIR